MFKKVCIIGCGLIGSSIARGIKKNKLATKVVSSNRSNSTNKKIIRLKIVNEASSDTKKIVKGSDLIIIASPLSSYKNIILKIKSSLKNGVILTDVGSVKKNVISLIEKNIPKNVSWISSHPIAGTEESGPESGFSELFKNRWCILTPSKKSKNKDVVIVRLEQLYPFPAKTLANILKRYKNADFIWCQEEPKNMGGWNTVRNYIQWSLNYIKADDKEIKYIGRKPAASPASGYLKKHLAEQNEILEKVVGKF